MITLDSVGSEQNIKGRPCIIVQNDIGNKFSQTTIIIPLTKQNKKDIPTHYLLKKEDYPFLDYDSLALAEQIRCVDINTRHLERKIGRLNEEDLRNILQTIDKNFH